MNYYLAKELEKIAERYEHFTIINAAPFTAVVNDHHSNFFLLRIHGNMILDQNLDSDDSESIGNPVLSVLPEALFLPAVENICRYTHIHSMWVDPREEVIFNILDEMKMVLKYFSAPKIAPLLLKYEGKQVHIESMKDHHVLEIEYDLDRVSVDILDCNLHKLAGEIAAYLRGEEDQKSK